MSSILVVFTGGTIGSSLCDGWISPDGSTRHLIIEKYRNKTGDKDTVFIPQTPYTTLSEYLSAKEINLLSDCLFDNIEKEYDGIIVTHGTDTIQYTAAALSYMLADAPLPIVLVSAAYPLEDERSNGVSNFIGAVEFIKKRAGKGVFVSYKNEGSEKTDIHIGTRLASHMEGDADIFSIDRCPYGFYDEKGITVLKDCEKPLGAGRVELSLYPEILMIESRAGERYDYDLSGVKAIILVPYHSATLNTKDENFINLCLEAREKGIPVFLVNKRKGVTYESSKLYDDLRIEILPFSSKISIYVKCWIGISKNLDLREFVKTPVAYEFCE